MPLVALLGAVDDGPDRVGDQRRRSRPAGVGLCWMLLGRIGVRSAVRPAGLTILFGFSTQILWVTTRGGVWHTGQLIATILTFACLIELWGQPAGVAHRAAGRRGVPDPRAAGVRDPVLRADARTAPAPEPAEPEVAGGYIALDRPSERLRAWVWLGLGVLPAIVAFFAYNQVRFGSPFESGYALATLPRVPRGATGRSGSSPWPTCR